MSVAIQTAGDIGTADAPAESLTERLEERLASELGGADEGLTELVPEDTSVDPQPVFS